MHKDFSVGDRVVGYYRPGEEEAVACTMKHSGEHCTVEEVGGAEGDPRYVRLRHPGGQLLYWEKANVYPIIRGADGHDYHVGSRVLIHPRSRYAYQHEGVGIIKSIASTGSRWAIVRWDDGYENGYPLAETGFCHLVLEAELPEEPKAGSGAALVIMRDYFVRGGVSHFAPIDQLNSNFGDGFHYTDRPCSEEGIRFLSVALDHDGNIHAAIHEKGACPFKSYEEEERPFADHLGDRYTFEEAVREGDINLDNLDEGINLVRLVEDHGHPFLMLSVREPADGKFWTVDSDCKRFYCYFLGRGDVARFLEGFTDGYGDFRIYTIEEFEEMVSQE